MQKQNPFLLFLISFLVSFLGTENTLAQSMCKDIFSKPSRDQIIRSVMKKMKKNNLYEDGFCNCNVQKLLAHLVDYNVNIDSAKVLYVIPTSESEPLLQANKTKGEDYEWDMHAILMMDGKIYDLDYDGPPTKARSYFQKMFNVKENDGHGIFIRVIPARDYLADHQDYRLYTNLYENKDPRADTIRDVYWYLEEAVEYPLISVTQIESIVH